MAAPVFHWLKLGEANQAKIDEDSMSRRSRPRDTKLATMWHQSAVPESL
ncbi:MAG: hypothetical protein ACXWIF_13055 [Pyrinomonadaceae bacterium]